MQNGLLRLTNWLKQRMRGVTVSFFSPSDRATVVSIVSLSMRILLP